MLQMSFSQGSVGVAPGTTTLYIPNSSPKNNLGWSCGPEPIFPYITPPRFKSEIYAPFGPVPVTNVSSVEAGLNPYATESHLTGIPLVPSFCKLKCLLLAGGILAFLFLRK